MKIAYFPNQIALNAQPVLEAFIKGCRSIGITMVPNQQDADAAVIWSVLWNGRLRGNQAVYEHYRKQGKPVFILEVGSLVREKTWKLSVNNINGEGIFPNLTEFIADRENILGVHLKPVKSVRNNEILIATQHGLSQQWYGMPKMSQWVTDTLDEIKRVSARPVVIRFHPRHPLRLPNDSMTRIEYPRKISQTYDNYDINYNYHCVINWNSGVAVQAAIEGCPVITGPSSLAAPISCKMTDIEHAMLPDRTEWFRKILHTEWLIEELAQGIPQKRLLNQLNC
jgi:hypothetical protein